MANSFTRFGTILGGLGVFTAGILTSSVVGSYITKGDVVFDTIDQPTWHIRGGTTAVLQGSGTYTTAINVTRPINAPRGNGVMTGMTLQVDGISRVAYMRVPFTATGGTNGIGGMYNTLLVRPPRGFSGAILQEISVECNGMAIPILGSGGITKTVQPTTGSVDVRALGTFSLDKTLGSGSRITYSTGATFMAPDDLFVFRTGTVVPKTTNQTCTAFPIFRDFPGR